MAIDYETDGHVARITINRPEGMNSIDRAHNAGLEEVWRRLNEDPNIRVGVLTGAGVRAPWSMGGITYEAHYGKSMVAAINGHALAGGLELALACDILGWAMEMILTGESVDADTALRIGLVNRILPQNRLLDEAMQLAATIASRGPLAVRAARRPAVPRSLSKNDVR